MSSTNPSHTGGDDLPRAREHWRGCIDCVGRKPFATIAAHDTFVGTVEVLWNKTLVSLMDHVQIWGHGFTPL